METDDNGHLVIQGLPSDVTLTVVETKAPAGYNKLVNPVNLSPAVIGQTVTVTSTTIYYDENGDVVEEVTETSSTTIEYNEDLETAALEIQNRKGPELPSTGGMGTTVFYVLGSVMVLAAAVLLITRKRMNFRG